MGYPNPGSLLIRRAVLHSIARSKGGIESEAGYFRRNHWVPLPKARDLEDLNTQLVASCRADERRQMLGRAGRWAR